MSWQQRIDAALSERCALHALRQRQPLTRGAGRWLDDGERRYLNFSSNDYLGLSQHPQVVKAWQEGATRFSVTARFRWTISRSISGPSPSRLRRILSARRKGGPSIRR